MLLIGQKLRIVHSKAHRQKLNSASIYIPTVILLHGTVFSVYQFFLKEFEFISIRSISEQEKNRFKLDKTLFFDSKIKTDFSQVFVTKLSVLHIPK